MPARPKQRKQKSSAEITCLPDIVDAKEGENKRIVHGEKAGEVIEDYKQENNISCQIFVKRIKWQLWQI
jgi:hypothetical protein